MTFYKTNYNDNHLYPLYSIVIFLSNKKHNKEIARLKNNEDFE